MIEYVVIICDLNSGKEVKEFKPCKTLIGASRLEDAVIEKTDLDKYFVGIKSRSKNV